jgi:hypothetical protein
MQNCHDHLEGGAMLLFVHVHGDSTAIILNRDAVVFVDAHVYFVAIACQGFVDGVVDNLIDQVVEAAEIDVADVHGWTHADGLKTFEYGDVAGAVVVLSLLFFAHIIMCFFIQK